MTKRPHKKDPYFKREASRYDEPIVSREFIRSHLDAAGKPLSFSELLADFAIEAAQEEALSRRLGAMIRDGQLHCNTEEEYHLIDDNTLLEGVVEVDRDGFGRVFIAHSKTVIGLSKNQLRQVFPGDKVAVNIIGMGPRGHLKGAITKVISRAQTEFVGRFHTADAVNYVVPENSKINQDIMVLAGETNAAKNEQFVTVKITTWPTLRTQAIGTIVKVLGESMSASLAIEVAKKAFDLPCEWPKGVLNEIKSYPPAVSDPKDPERKNLTALPFVTIDGEDARDFDDAVYAEMLEGDFRLYVAIADVSHYVPLGSDLDEEAQKRGTSIYFPNQVIPMLPEALSNELCSLKPNVLRLTLVCEMIISKEGELKSYQFYKSLIQSKARLTYARVGQYLQDGQFKNDTPPQPVVNSIDCLYQLYNALTVARDKRGALAFNSLETRIILNQAEQVEKIASFERNDAHKLIEECMLMANVAAARYILKHKCPGLYRVHESPDSEKIANLREFLSFRGVVLKGGASPKVQELNAALKAFEGHDDQQIVQNMVLRSMQQAVYVPDNGGHYGLGFEAYAHFTSPIRRYPDLIIHRIIKSLLSEQDPKSHRYSLKTLTEQGTSLSFRERRAEEASRDVEKSLKCAYMAEKVGETYAGVISGVTNFGFFVTITSLLVDGLVHCKNLHDDYYILDEKHHQLVGERTRRSFQFGDEVTVQVAHVDLSDRKIDFELINAQGGSVKTVKSKQPGFSVRKKDSKKPHMPNKKAKSTKSRTKNKTAKNGDKRLNGKKIKQKKRQQSKSKKFNVRNKNQET